MSRKYLSCAETAKLVRVALKEAFPGIKFGVRSSTYSMGASMSVSWVDGPNSAQVEAVTRCFTGSYFDGSIDYKGSVYHMLNGEPVSFGADFIHCTRAYSESMIQAAIDRVFRRFAGNFSADGIAKPTVEDYQRGRLWSVYLCGLNDSLQTEISHALCKQSDRLAVAKSKTAASVFVTHDDGYSRSCGCGMSAVALDSAE
jgi:hypothetical protein